MDQYEIFRAFFEEEEAVAYHALLVEHGIPARMEKRKQPVDKILIGDTQAANFQVKIRPSDFNRANEIIDQQIQLHLAELENEHYLFSFSTEELLQIIHQPDEWSNQDVILARKLLEDSGHPISDAAIKQIKADRINLLATPEKEETFWVVVGYLLSFSVIGIFMGLFFRNGKKILPDGRKVAIYSASTRQHGENILIISGIFFVLTVIGFLTNTIQLYRGSFIVRF